MSVVYVGPDAVKRMLDAYRSAWRVSTLRKAIQSGEIRDKYAIKSLVGVLKYVGEPKQGSYGQYQTIVITDTRDRDAAAMVFYKGTKPLKEDDKGKVVLFKAGFNRGNYVGLTVSRAKPDDGRDAWPTISATDRCEVIIERDSGIVASAFGKPQVAEESAVASQRPTEYDVAEAMATMARMFRLSAEAFKEHALTGEDISVSDVLRDYGEYVRMIALTIVRRERSVIDLSGQINGSVGDGSVDEVQEPEEAVTSDDMPSPEEFVADELEEDEVPF